ncbi:MAG: aspartate carbamoyltransferase [Fimbriimonadaceae bacterium]|nr:aspartate carbamoyltransferase [Fimbriimonadaceae bacterium]
MSLAGRSLIRVDDFSAAEMQHVLNVAETMHQRLHERQTMLAGSILATAFFEPSTRTRLSFESAMQRLGGGVIGFADATTSSAVKGETLADTARIIESYADVIVMRHPLEGSVKVAADYASKPVINAGDGGHQHPTQTLTDLFTIQRARGDLNGLQIGLCGDLRFGRTVHSLLAALGHYQVKVLCIAPPSLQLPERYRPPGVEVEQVQRVEDVLPDLDVLYVTRIQRERFPDASEYEAVKGSYRIDAALLEQSKPELLVMHPLPRVDEIAYNVDPDRRAAYFGQAAYGVPVRMALLALLLDAESSAGVPGPAPLAQPVEHHPRCPNPDCANRVEGYTEPQMLLVGPHQRRCLYCDLELTVG